MLIFPGVTKYYMQWLKKSKIFEKMLDIFIEGVYNSYC